MRVRQSTNSESIRSGRWIVCLVLFSTTFGLKPMIVAQVLNFYSDGVWLIFVLCCTVEWRNIRSTAQLDVFVLLLSKGRSKIINEEK